MFSPFPPLITVRFLGLAVIGLVGLTSCQHLRESREARALRKRVETTAENYRLFADSEGYRSNFYQAPEVLQLISTEEKPTIRVSLGKQRAYLMVKDEIGLDTPVSTGRKTHPTPKGSFKIIQKKEDHRSNLYGKILNRSGKTVRSGADSRKHAVPPGGKFVGASMPYWMRLTNTGIGFHVGRVPTFPASHGCIRLPKQVGPILFKHVALGTPVEIVP